LASKEEQLVTALDQNSAQLIPLEVNAAQLTKKAELLVEINKKLAIAEEGKLKEIAASQDQLSNEKNLAVSLGEIRDEYAKGIDLSDWAKEFVDYEEATKPLTGAPASNAALLKIKDAMDRVNKFLVDTEKKVNAALNTASTEITSVLQELQRAQKTLETQINLKITQLQKKGLAGTIADHQARLKEKSAVTQEINKIKGQATLLARLRKSRADYLNELINVRAAVTQRRKDQLKSINDNLAATIEDYTVFVHYEPSGIPDDFCAFIREKMRGSYFQEEMAGKLCSQMMPPRLASLLLERDSKTISDEGGISEEWADEICQKLRRFQTVHALQSMWKPPCPVITAKMKGTRPKDIPMDQLSDGQKHTILLTIAMLAESNIPLVIDQPEDDLDNAFISSAVVKTLRSIKERRQVILVTHNANIAVLGDAELLMPMRRQGDGGTAFDRGSIDKTDTKQAALNILEGGRLAFERRREVYGH
jgi:putative AbiEii toxin of type IV toxin-antitoxin system